MQKRIPKKNCPWVFLFVISMLFFYLAKTWAAPPFFTDDAEPAPYHQLQFYPYLTINSAAHTATIDAPAVETNYGIIPHLELHLIVNVETYLPVTNYIVGQGKRATGIGDSELGIKYQFLQESAYVPEVAIAPALELATGNANRVLGNGRTWSVLPVWIEKHVGAWTTYGGIGFAFNAEPQMKNYQYGGWLLQRDMNEKLSLAAEIYLQGSTTTSRQAPLQDTGAFTLVNIGGNYNFNSFSSLLFAAGHSVSGTPQWTGYFGLFFAL